MSELILPPGRPASPSAYELYSPEDLETYAGLAEHPKETEKRLRASGGWDDAKMCLERTMQRYLTLYGDDEPCPLTGLSHLVSGLPLRPFRKRVIEAHGARCEAFRDGECVEVPCQCREGIKPFLKKSAAYHAIRKVVAWEEAGPARVEFVRRLVSEDHSPSRANLLSWRLFEDALFWSEGEGGFDLAILGAEFTGMLAFGEEREYPVEPSKDQIATTLEKRDRVFPSEWRGCRLPTTVMHFYKELGLWAEAEMFLRMNDPDHGEIGFCSTNVGWQFLAVYLESPSSVEEIRDKLRRYLTGQLRLGRKACPRRND